MSTFMLKISSPEGDLFSNNVCAVFLRGTEGELAVMAGHIPFITSIVPCNCKIELEDGTTKVAKTNGGILNVSKDKVLFLSGSFEWVE